MSSEDNKEGRITDVVKKMISIGVGAAFLTEDSVKTLVQDLPLPKDVVQGLVKNAQTAKSDVVSAVRQETAKMLERVDLRKVIMEALENYDIQVKADIKFKPKKGKKASKKS